MEFYNNTLINSDCLILLEHMLANQSTLIYIDLPWSEKIKDIEFISRVLQQSRRILNERGSIFFHLPSQIPPALRVIMDQIFGENNYRNQIIWPVKVWNSDMTLKSRYEVLLHYSKSENLVLKPQFRSLTKEEINETYPNEDENGPYRLINIISKIERPQFQFEFRGFKPKPGYCWRYSKEALEELNKQGKIFFKENVPPRLKRYSHDTPGIEIEDIWNDISNLIPQSQRVHYYSQQPISLIERIINLCTNEGDLVLDPFCGSGTSLIAAQRLGRRWIGCDNNDDAIQICQERLNKELDQIDINGYITLTQDQILMELPVYTTYVPVFSGILGHLTRIGRPRFVVEQEAQIEENRVFEFKEITKNEKPRDVIKRFVDEYVVGFLNSDGGSLFFGIEDKHRIVKGMNLNFEERDDVRKLIQEKLNRITPKIDPTAFRIEFHPVFDEQNQIIIDKWIIEIMVPYTPSPLPYITENGRTFVKTLAINKEMDAHQIIQWYLQRITTS